MFVLQTPSYLISFEWDSCAKIILVFCAHIFVWRPLGKRCHGRAKTKFMTIIYDFSKKTFFYTMSLIISKFAKL
jgi:hypothetical protein